MVADSFFDFGSNTEEYKSPDRFFREISFNSHMAALRRGGLGAFLAVFKDEKVIEFKYNESMPDDVRGRYVYRQGSRVEGFIEMRYEAHAAVLGHEIRHAWQHLCLPDSLAYPDSPEKQVMLDRFVEADARAVEFGVALQTIHNPGSDESRYAGNLMASLDDYQKEIFEHSAKMLHEISNSPDLFRQAMRQAFDRWIAFSPAAGEHYRTQTEGALRDASASGGLLKGLFNVRNKWGSPRYAAKGLGDYPQRLAEALGYLGDRMEGNYLTDTKGLAFDSKFYTRICDFRLERAVEGLSRRL